ncbi:hypothetical protein J4H86_09305 [Spiractinospora alimapuensis]|uniref:DUF998 domain-containing protein n=1 Tax=Spiractinospora alimapuensis TaxID=2820884 RepID=UPI001F17A6E8|nr:DUF998 domain-containing protein [Spiractinospora alimapuensis]QVQ53883.1 hypothetical protein J4H86_09305 [Spiractinospora alimapuensis]
MTKDSRSRAPAWLALGAIAGPLLFTLGWFVIGLVSPGYPVGGDYIAPYSVVSQPISGLGMGVTALAMNLVFVLSGLLLAVGIIGAFRSMTPVHHPARHWIVAALLCLSPAGSVLAGLFDLEHPVPHLAGFLLITATPIVSFVVAGLYFRTLPGWHRFGVLLPIGSVAALILLVSFFVSFDQATTAANEGVAGLTSRALGIAVHTWFVVLGWKAWRQRG